MLTLKQAADKAGVTLNGLRYWTSRGMIPTSRPDGVHVMIDPDDLQPLIEARMLRELAREKGAQVATSELDRLYDASHSLATKIKELEDCELRFYGTVTMVEYLQAELEALTGEDYAPRHVWAAYADTASGSNVPGEHDCHALGCPRLDGEA